MAQRLRQQANIPFGTANQSWMSKWRNAIESGGEEMLEDAPAS